MPKIEYTLSFENYLEMMSGSRKKVQVSRIATASAVSGLCCFAAGYSLLKLNVRGGAFFPGGLLLMTGLVLTLLAMFIGLFATTKSPRWIRLRFGENMIFSMPIAALSNSTRPDGACPGMKVMMCGHGPAFDTYTTAKRFWSWRLPQPHIGCQNRRSSLSVRWTSSRLWPNLIS